MQLPNYLADQNEKYIKDKGYSFRDFSSEQIIDELRMKDIRISLHGTKRERGGSFKTISDSVPLIGHKTRWASLKNPITSNIYRCVRLLSRRKNTQGIDKRKALNLKNNRPVLHVVFRRWFDSKLKYSLNLKLIKPLLRVPFQYYSMCYKFDKFKRKRQINERKRKNLIQSRRKV